MKKTLTIVIALAVIVVIGFVLMNKHSGRAPLSGSDQVVDLHVPVQLPEGISPVTDGTYAVWEGSFIDWAANKTVLPNWIDRGTVAVPTGSVTVSAGIPVAGTFDFDLNSIASTGTGTGDEDDTLQKLTDHLKSPDWFNTAQYPTARFVLTRAIPSGDVSTSYRYTVTGRLTIKDITQEITFDAYIYEMMGKLMVQGSVDVDRTLWDIRFGSAKFFQDLGDKVINDTFVVNMNIATMKAQ